MATRVRPGRSRARGATTILLLTLLVHGAVRRAVACDICAIYTATEQREVRPGLHLGIAEQYTYFGTERLGGTEVTLPASEHEDSSVTQLLVGYGFTPRFGLQLNVPYIDRRFTRIHDHQLERGSETGIGDMALLANLLVYRAVVGRGLFHFSVLGGVKFPTGDPDRLAEEVEPAPAGGAKAHAAASTLPAQGGLHGHDLALGSGSFDGIVGGQIFWSWGRLFTSAAMQYAIRSTGAFDYRYANDLTWVGGPGWFVLLGHDYSVGAQAVLSGETKGKDTQQGQKADDTAMTALYAGPGVSVTWRSLAAELAVDLPVIQHNTALQLVPDVRVRGGFTWHF